MTGNLALPSGHLSLADHKDAFMATGIEIELIGTGTFRFEPALAATVKERVLR